MNRQRANREEMERGSEKRRADGEKREDGKREHLKSKPQGERASAKTDFKCNSDLMPAMSSSREMLL